jgi:hypothetical protein
MPSMHHIDRIEFSMEFWTPARIAQPRMMMGYEVHLRGALFALQAEIYSPGPFDDLDDVGAVMTDRWHAMVAHIEAQAPTRSD